MRHLKIYWEIRIEDLLSRSRLPKSLQYRHKSAHYAFVFCTEQAVDEMVEALNQWEKASFRYHARARKESDIQEAKSLQERMVAMEEG